MYQRTITKATLTAFHRHLQEAERRPATIAKYLREVQDFARHLEPGQPGGEGNRSGLEGRPGPAHAAGTVNGKLAALNTFFHLPGLGECRVKPSAANGNCSGMRAGTAQGDYLRLLAAAKGRATGGSTTSWRPWPPRGSGCRN